MNIAAYKEMLTLRARRKKKAHNKLDEFGPQKSIIDSSQLVGAIVIADYIRRRKVRKSDGTPPFGAL